MSEYSSSDVRLINGHACITTTEFKNRLGINVTGHDLHGVGIIPVAEGPTAVYWNESDVSTAALVFARNLLSTAIRYGRRA